MNKLADLSHLDPHRYVLLTGATGLLGQYLMRDLLAAGFSLAVLVRPSKRESAASRVESMIQRLELELGRTLTRPKVIEGDVRESDLGITSDDNRWLAEHCSTILHNAATLEFFGSNKQEEPWLTNYVGTQNLVEFARRAGISNFHHVSTAYVCGQTDKALVMEDDLDCGQSFRNAYEECKFAAEMLVRNASHLVNPTIYRPVVIVGDSKTGFTSTYHGLFLYLRLVATLVPMQRQNEFGLRETPIQLPFTGDEPRNLVPVDWVSEVMVHLFAQPAAQGKTFHLAPDHCLTAKEVIDYCCEYFNSSGVEYLGPDADRKAANEFSTRYFENVGIYQPYDTSDPQFDKTNLKKFAGDLICPKIDKHMVFRFIEFGQANRWGKKAPSSKARAKILSAP